jgi:hypothetical protein
MLSRNMKLVATFCWCTVVVSVMWFAVLTWFYLISGLILFLAFLVGPIAMVMGVLLILRRGRTRAGAIVALAGCAFVSLLYAWALRDHLVEPLETKDPLTLYIVFGVATLIGDITGVFSSWSALREGRASNQTLQPTAGHSDV